MIILKTSNFITFILLIIIASIGIYIELFPCNCSCEKKIRKINICKGRIKYIPIFIDKDIHSKNKDIYLKNKMDSKNKVSSPKNYIQKKLKKNIENSISSASIGNHTSTHGASIVPSVWIEDDKEEYEFSY